MPKTAEPEQEKLIETDHPEDKPLIKQIKKVAACNKTESDARTARQEEGQKLIDMMKERGLETYKHGEDKASLKHLERVKVETEKSNVE